MDVHFDVIASVFLHGKFRGKCNIPAPVIARLLRIGTEETVAMASWVHMTRWTAHGLVYHAGAAFFLKGPGPTILYGIRPVSGLGMENKLCFKGCLCV